VQLEHGGSPNTQACNISILSEVQRLRQENIALRSENAELRGSPPQIPQPLAPPQNVMPMVAAGSTECGLLANNVSSPLAAAACQQNFQPLVSSPAAACQQSFQPLAPPQMPMVATGPTECGLLVNAGLANGVNVPTAVGQQDLRFGAPLRYVVVASPVGAQTGHFEFGFDASDAQHIWRCS